MRTKLGLICLIVCGTFPVHAQDWNCDDPDNLSQQGMNMCALEEFNDTDAELNATWKVVYTKLKSRDVEIADQWKGLPEAVLVAQRAWIAFRDAHCTSAGFQYRGGSIEPLIYHSCRTQLTRTRTQQILNFLER